MKNPFRSLAAKLLLFTGGATVVTLLGAMIASGIDSSTRTREAVYRDAESTAGSVASTITREISALSSAVATMSTTLGSVNESGTKQRSMVLAMMKSVVSQYDLAFGVTFIEENAAWDGQTGASLMGNNQTGDFAAYWSKETGDITFTSVPTTREDPWYKVPATTRKATLTEPFVYDSGTKKIMMTTIAYPVMAAGQFIGVGSFDVNLETLSANVASMRPFGEGRVMLVSGSGAWLATPEADLLMKPYQEAGEGDLMAAIADGKARMLHDVETKNGPVERIIYPFSIPGLNTSWAAIVDVPADVIAAPIRSQLAMLVIGGMVILAVLLVALYSSTLLIVRRPVAMLLNSVDRLGRGDLDTPVIGQMRKDEIGGLSKSLDGFRLALRQGRNAELQAEAERESADRERRESEAERAAGATQQALVVDGLSEALKHLSSGNLSFELSRPFPERFEALRSDYNQAVGQLRASMNAVARSTSSIDNGSREISKSADDLSRRT